MEAGLKLIEKIEPNRSLWERSLARFAFAGPNQLIQNRRSVCFSEAGTEIVTALRRLVSNIKRDIGQFIAWR